MCRNFSFFHAVLAEFSHTRNFSAAFRKLRLPTHQIIPEKFNFRHGATRKGLRAIRGAGGEIGDRLGGHSAVLKSKRGRA